MTNTASAGEEGQKGSLSSFQYQPLDPTRKEIRLLEIEPSEHGFSSSEPVRCRVRHVSLLSSSSFSGRRKKKFPPRYEAVSYVWGDSALPKGKIFLDGGYELEVPATSEEVLRRVRRRGAWDKKLVGGGGGGIEGEEGDGDGIVMDEGEWGMDFDDDDDGIVMDGEEEWGEEDEEDEGEEEDDGYRAIWIDAVCINQDDTPERSQQVGMMADIYREAQQTIVWLGTMPPRVSGVNGGGGGEELQRDLDLVLMDMWQDETWRNRMFAGEWREPTATTVAAGDRPKELSASSSSALPGENFRALFELYKAPWFRRIWVIQEIALAKKSVCLYGDLELSALSILRAAWWLRDRFLDRRPAQSFDALNAAVTMQSYSDPLSCTSPGTIGWSRITVDVFNHMRSSLVTDPRDRVYGLLGLMDMEDPVTGESLPIPQLLVPDYSKSLAEVYRDATRFSLQGDSDVPLQPIVDYLYHPEDNNNIDKESGTFPSWVIRWDINPSSAPTPFLSHRFRASSSSSSTLPLQLSRPSYQEPNILRLTGFVLDTVKSTSSNTYRHSDINTPHGARDLLSEVEQLIEEVEPDNDDKGENNSSTKDADDDQDPSFSSDFPSPLLNALALTLISSSFSFFEKADPQSAREGFDAWRRNSFSLSSPSTTTTKNSDQLAAATRYKDRLGKTLVLRRFFVTTGSSSSKSARGERRRMGIGPSITKPGDIIVIVGGSPCPLLLRPSRPHHSSSSQQGKGEQEQQQPEEEEEFLRYKLLGACYVHGVMDGIEKEKEVTMMTFDVE